MIDKNAIQMHNISMWITRNIESLIKEYAKEFPALIITGARQVGKTSILRHLFPDVQYVNLDDPVQAARAENTPKEFIESLNVPVIIDEAQYAPSLFRYLKLYLDKTKKKGQYLLTGSQQFPLMQNVSESLAGRCGVINLYPLTASEIAKVKHKYSIEEIIARGGYPELYAEKKSNPKHWYPSYISTYLERDVRNIVNISSLREFNLFMRVLALRTGQVLSIADIARDVGVAPNTVKSWLSILEASQHIYLLKPYHRNAGKRLVKSPKIYFCDTGLVTQLMGLSSWAEVRDSLYVGAIWETYVFNQIFRYFINKGETNPNIWFWRTNIGDEVDFLIDKGGRFTVIESKLTETPAEKDLKGIKSLKRYYGDKSVLKAFLACKVSDSFGFNKEVVVSNFVDCSILE